jgi:predicted nucleotidyltransferase
VYLFGSYAEARAHAESDIDVGVLLHRDLYPGPRERFAERVRLTAWLVGVLGVNAVDVARDPRFPTELVRTLEWLPGFRNIVVHEYIALDMERVVEVLDELEPIERFLQIVRRLLQ